MSTATIALRTRPRPLLGPALRPARLPVGSIALSAVLHALGLGALILLAMNKAVPSKTYVVNLVPAIAAVGTPQGRANVPAPALPPRPSDVTSPAKTSPRDLPHRERRAPAPPPETPARPSAARTAPRAQREVHAIVPPETPVRPRGVSALPREQREAPAPAPPEMPSRPSAVRTLPREQRETPATPAPEIPARPSMARTIPREQREVASIAGSEVPARLSAPMARLREQREAQAIAPPAEMPARPSLRESLSALDRSLPSHPATLPRPGDKELPPTAPPRGTESLPKREVLAPPLRGPSETLPRREALAPAPRGPSEPLPSREPPARAISEPPLRREVPPPLHARGSSELLPRRQPPVPAARATSEAPPRSDASPPPPAPLGHIAGSAQGVGAVTLSVSDFPYAWYIQAIHRKIQERWEGHAMDGQQPEVIFEIGGDGRLRRLAIGKTSGNPAYDQVAMRAVDDANPFPPLPTGFKKPTLTVGLQFIYDARGR
jgi:TonB family protein